MNTSVVMTVAGTDGSHLDPQYIAAVRQQQAQTLHRLLREEAQRRGVPPATRRLLRDAADCIADLTGMFSRPVPSQQPHEIQQSFDPAFDTWAQFLDDWATSPEGTAELAAMEDRLYAEESLRASTEWKNTVEF